MWTLTYQLQWIITYWIIITTVVIELLLLINSVTTKNLVLNDLPYEEWSCHIAITPHTNVLTALLGGKTSLSMSNWPDGEFSTQQILS